MMMPTIYFRVKINLTFPDGEVKVINHDVVRGVPELQRSLEGFGLNLSNSRLYSITDSEYAATKWPEWMNPFPDAVERHIRIVRGPSIHEAYSK